NEGIGQNGATIQPISGNQLPTTIEIGGDIVPIQPGEDGLYFTANDLGFYDFNTDSWPVRLQNDDGTGKARFGNNDRFMEWDGANLNIQGNAQSPNFAAGVEGWRIDVDGSAEFNDVTVRGTVEAALGNIGNWTIDDPDLRDDDNRILLRPDSRRIEVRDALGVVKVAMGYLGGVEDFDPTTFGFYLGEGNSLDWSGDIDYREGDFRVEDDSSLVLFDGDGNEIGRIGSLGGGDVGIDIGNAIFGEVIGGGGATGTFGDAIGGGGATGDFTELLGGGGAKAPSASGFAYSVENAKLTVIGEFESFGNTTFQNLTIDNDLSVGGSVSFSGGLSAASAALSGSLNADNADFDGDVDIDGVLKKGSNNPDLQGGGRAAGFYTGSDRDEINYPIGTVVLVQDFDFGTPTDRNDDINIRLSGTRGFTVSGPGSILTGTWKQRGGVSAGSNIALFQRIS
ncbi:MAG: hypothetical protein LAT68_14210, partial [Cyclobacteriaceae bacterium]|nr:hypothetical protein [Cyclobacteriaceae bacterium]